MATEDVIMLLRGEIGDFQAKMAAARGEVAELSAKGQSGFSQFQAVAGTAFLAVGAAAVAAGAFGLKMADDYEAAHARLTTAVKNTGGDFEELSGKVKATDSQMEHLGFTNADTESSLATLTGATHNSQQAMGLMGLAADIARGRHVDLATATGILVKVETGHVALLGRLGINTKDATGATISQEEAVKRLTALYGGQASAYTETFSGKIAVLKAKGEDLGKTIGLDLIPVVEGLATAGLDAVNGLEAANSATGGFLGEIALIGGGTVLAVGAVSKLSEGVSFLATKLGLHAAAADADVAATAAQETAYDGLLAAQAAVVQSDAELVAAHGAVTSAAEAIIAAQSAAADAVVTAAAAQNQAILDQISADADLLAVQEQVATGALSLADAQVALAAAQASSAAAATGAAGAEAAVAATLATAEGNAAAAALAAAAADDVLAVSAAAASDAQELLASSQVAEGLAAVGQGAEGAAVGIGSMVPVLGLAVGGSVALGLGFEKLFNLLPDDTAQVKAFSAALLGTSKDAQQAQADLSKVVGTQVSGDLANYSTQLLSNADAKTLNATKTQALVDAEHQAAASIFGQADAAKLSTADIDRLAQSNELLNRRIQDGNANVDTATKTMDGLVAKYGLAAVQTQELDLAQRKYADDLASGHASVAQLAADHDAVVKAAGKVATVQNVVNAATQQGTTDTKAADAANKERQKSLTALGAVIGATAAKTVAAAGVSTPALDALTTSLKDMDKAFEGSFTKADNVLDTFKDKSKVSYQEFINAQFKSIVATANWSNNIATLSKDGIDQGFLQTLIDAGPSSAGVVQTLLDNVSKGSIGTVNKMEEAARAAQTKTEAELNAVKVKAATTAAFIDTLDPKFKVGADTAGAFQSINDVIHYIDGLRPSVSVQVNAQGDVVGQHIRGSNITQHASGGLIGPGEISTVGEAGIELAVGLPGGGAQILSNAQSRHLLGTRGGGGTIHIGEINIVSPDPHLSGRQVIAAIQDFNRTHGPANIKVTAG